ncbi:MAG: hypothetical protein ACRDBO_17525 [Lachnospiraceae bacterium]
MKKEKKDIRSIVTGIASGLLFAALIVALVIGVRYFSGRANEQGADTLRNGIRRASVQCYAIEGRYPPSVGYLEENYGIQIDRDRYHVFYNGFASNIMPEITVIPVWQEE